MLTAICMQRGESRAAVIVLQGAAVGPVFARRCCRTEPASSHSAGLVEVVGEILAARGEGLGGGVDRLANRHQIPVGVRAEDRHAEQVMRMPPARAPPARAPRYLSSINFDSTSTRRTRTPSGTRPHASWSIFRSPRHQQWGKIVGIYESRAIPGAYKHWPAGRAFGYPIPRTIAVG
jgi:hypothetical protein